MIQLSPATQKYIAALRDEPHISVLFVCLGNICRSPAAEGVMQRIVDEHHVQKRWTLDSAGIGGWHVGQLPDRRMRVHARERGLELTHRCRQVHVSDFDDFDLIIGMDDQNIADLRSLAPTVEVETRIVPMAAFLPAGSRYDHVPDPYYEGAEGFELVLDLLDTACLNLFHALTK